MGSGPPAGERSTNPLPVGPTLGHCPAASRFVAAAGGSFQGGGMTPSCVPFARRDAALGPHLAYGIESQGGQGKNKMLYCAVQKINM